MNVFLIALENFIRKFGRNLFLTLGLCVSLGLCYSGLVLYLNSSYYKTEITKMLQHGEDGILAVTVDSGSIYSETYEEDMEEFLEEFRGLKVLSEAGAFYTAGVYSDRFSEASFRSLNENSGVEYLENHSGSGYGIYTDETLLRLCGIDSAEARYGECLAEGIVPVYVGCLYRDYFTVGERLQINDRNCEIVGILPKGTTFFGTNGLFLTSAGVTVLDTCFVLPFSARDAAGSCMHSVYGKIAGGNTAEDAAAAVTACAEAHSLHVSVQTVGEKLEVLWSMEEPFTQDSLYLMLLFVSVSMVSQLIVGLVSVELRRRETGVLLISGFSEMQIAGIFGTENLFRALLAFPLAIWISDKEYIDIIALVNDTVKLRGQLLALLLLVLMEIVVTVIPAAMLRRRSVHFYMEDEL